MSGYQPARPTQIRFLAELAVKAGNLTSSEALDLRHQLNCVANRKGPHGSEEFVLAEIDRLLDRLPVPGHWQCSCRCGGCPASHCGVASRGCVWADPMALVS